MGVHVRAYLHSVLIRRSDKPPVPIVNARGSSIKKFRPPGKIRVSPAPRKLIGTWFSVLVIFVATLDRLSCLSGVKVFVGFTLYVATLLQRGCVHNMHLSVDLTP